MNCTGLSVIRGTADLVVRRRGARRDRRPDRPRRRRACWCASRAPRSTRPASAPGFSGSPILCDGAQRRRDLRGHRRVRQQGRARHADRGDPAAPARAPRPRAREAPGLLRAARPLAGAAHGVRALGAHAGACSTRAAARAGRAVLAAPAGPLGGYPGPARSCPAPRWRRRSPPATSASARSARSPTATATRSARSATRSTALGPRGRCSSQDAYVFGVIGNPLGDPRPRRDDLQAHLGRRAHARARSPTTPSPRSPGNLGAAPASIPLRVTARARGPRARRRSTRSLADERALGFGASLSLVAPLAAVTGAGPAARTRSSPSRSRSAPASACASCAKPIGFCNPYFDALHAARRHRRRPRRSSTASTWRRCTSRGAAVTHRRSGAASPTTCSCGARAPQRVRAGSTRAGAAHAAPPRRRRRLAHRARCRSRAGCSPARARSSCRATASTLERGRRPARAGRGA